MLHSNVARQQSVKAQTHEKQSLALKLANYKTSIGLSSSKSLVVTGVVTIKAVASSHISLEPTSQLVHQGGVSELMVIKFLGRRSDRLLRHGIKQTSQNICKNKERTLMVKRIVEKVTAGQVLTISLEYSMANLLLRP